MFKMQYEARLRQLRSYFDRAIDSQERTREVTVPGDTCPELDQLVEDRDLTVSTDDAGHNLFENITVVGDNFYRDFLRATTSPRDILLIIDASGGLGQRALTARTNALTQIIDMFCGGFGGDSSSNRMGVVKFAYMASGLIQLGDDQSPDLLKEIVGDVRSTYINTCTGKALQMAYTMFDQQFGARPESSATHDTLLITDGKSDCQEDLLALSQRLQTRSNISAIAVGLGNEMEARAELQTVVSNQNPRRIFPLADYMDLEAMMAMLADTRGATADC
nr:hypothetical protein BaRGS_013718 [Batillaria attramentaria]